MRTWGAGAAMVILIAACGSGSSTHTVKGSLTVMTNYDSENPTVFTSDQKRCTGDNGYDDIGNGAAITIRDGKGAIVGAADLRGDGTVTHDGNCSWPFKVTGVKDADFYTVKITHRDGPTFKRSELAKNGWFMGLSLGG